MSLMVQYARVARRKLIDRVAATGVCTVDGHEPTSVPDAKTKVHCAIVNGPGEAVPQASSLANTTVYQSFILYLYLRMPLGKDDLESQIDPKVSDARDTILTALHNPLTYGSGVELDPVGAYGSPIQWAPGYLDQESVKFRAETITSGFVVFNAMEQVRT